MIACSPEKAIKNIFERSVKSLSDSRDQLFKTRKVLKKAVQRLATACQCNDSQVNDILDDIKSSANKRINLDALDSHLDKLAVHAIKNNTTRNRTADTDFYISLKTSLEGFTCTEACTSIVNELIDKKLCDKDISLQIIKLINDTTTGNI